MLCWFRTRASGVAATLLLSLAALGGSAVSPHEDDCHDPGCDAIVVHDATAHRITAPSTFANSHPLHCLVCHWTRTFRPQVTTKFVAAPAVFIRVYARFDLIMVARNAQIAQPPLRSPPVPPAA
ncbi:MAG: hypothetical protein HOP16_01870 [Acidobacteria bacterium]|nr:hypothetical protein [Acidobacteriota bacterium]